MGSEGAPPRKRNRKGGVVLTHLKPESENAFEWVWENWKPSAVVDKATGNVTQKVIRGDRLPAEENFQAIVDSGVATPDELRQAAWLYLETHPKVKEGFVQHVRTFFTLHNGRWAEAVRRIRKSKQDVVEVASA